MNLAIAASVLLLTGGGVSLFFLMRKFAAAGGNLPLTAEWIDQLSIERYRPMLHLLDSSDIQFLRGQPGFTPHMAARLRQQRCQIFRGYLRCLHTDFARVCAALKVLLCQSRVDRPDLAGVLLHHQVMFLYGMVAVQIRVFLYRCGLCSVDVADLVKIFDGMRLELRSLVPSAAMAANA